MRVLFYISILLTTNNIFTQTIKTIGTSGDYFNLSSIFSAINTGSLTGDIEIQIISNITETTTAALNA